MAHRNRGFTDLPIKNGDFRWQTLKFPDGKWASRMFSNSHIDHAAC
jgi:hypothetical protein